MDMDGSGFLSPDETRRPPLLPLVLLAVYLCMTFLNRIVPRRSKEFTSFKTKTSRQRNREGLLLAALESKTSVLLFASPERIMANGKPSASSRTSGIRLPSM